MQDTKISDWLESLASKTPTPGGGAVGALAAAVAAAQLAMVTAYTTGPKWQDQEARMIELNQALGKLRLEALALAQADAEAFEAVGAAYAMPKDNDEQKTARKAAIQSALIAAAVPPTKTAGLATHLTEIAAEISESGNPNVISDVAVGAAMARAALESAIVNIEINAQGIDDNETKQKLQQIIEDATDAINDADVAVELVRDRIKS